MEGRGDQLPHCHAPRTAPRFTGYTRGRLQDLLETEKAHLRAKTEQPFRDIKRQFSFQNISHRGNAKNDPKPKMLRALANLYTVRLRQQEPA